MTEAVRDNVLNNLWCRLSSLLLTGIPAAQDRFCCSETLERQVKILDRRVKPMHQK